MTSPGLTPDVIRRIRVLLVRQRIETVATASLCALERRAPDCRQHQYVRDRLLTLLVTVADDRWWSAYRVVERAAAVYKRTSDVLHSRVAFADVPQSLVDEWETVVRDLNGLYDAQRGSDR